MPVYFAKPANIPNPPVILVAMEIFGLHEYIKDVTRRVAKLGALAIAPDYYFRRGVDLTKISEIPQLMPHVNSKPDAELFADLDATVRWAKSQSADTNRLGIMGFCRGGRTVWEYCAHNPDVKAGVAFYGSLVDPDAQKAIWPKSPTQAAADMKAPVLGLYGEADQGIPLTQVDAMKAALQAASKTVRDQGLSGRAARLPCRLPAELPQGGRRGRLEPDGRRGSRNTKCWAEHVSRSGQRKGRPNGRPFFVHPPDGARTRAMRSARDRSCRTSRRGPPDRGRCSRDRRSPRP